MKKVKNLVVSLLVVLTVALAINFVSGSQVDNLAYRVVDEDSIDTYPLPFSLRQPTLTLEE